MDQKPDLNAQIEKIDPEAETVKNTDLSGQINNAADVKEAFAKIQREIPRSNQSADLSELYRQAGDLIHLLETSQFESRVSDEVDEIRETAQAEFARTARQINRRAVAIGASAGYAEAWGG